MTRPAAAPYPEYGEFSLKHYRYMANALVSSFSVAEGSVRAGKTIDHCFVAAQYLKTCPDRFHLASGATLGNAKINIGACNGYGLENLFHDRCHWGRHLDNDALFIDTDTGEKIVIFAGGGKADSFRKILGNSYGLWIATEINEHYDSEDSRTSFVKVALARQAAAKKPMVLWDLNPSSPNHPIYTDYIDRYRTEGLKGFNYEHFTLFDNASMTDEQRAAFIAKYRKDSVWYQRDILGQRVVAEGLIYRAFADDPAAWCVSREELRSRYYDTQNKRWKFEYIYLGVDFGGSGSAHTFVACAVTEDWHLAALRSERIDAHRINTERLTERFLAFGQVIITEYGRIDAAFCDSAEQTIINSFRGKAPFPVGNSRKWEINDRIRATDIMMALHVLEIVGEDCQTLISALSTCVWDKDKPGDWVRLDNGTSDIDTLDAFEYSWERLMKKLIREERHEQV